MLGQTQLLDILWKVTVGAVISLYGLFIKHIINHVSTEEMDRLRSHVQYRDNCEQIVKRLDGTNQDICKKLDSLHDKVDNLNAKQSIHNYNYCMFVVHSNIRCIHDSEQLQCRRGFP